MSKEHSSGAKGKDAFQLFPDIMSTLLHDKKPGTGPAARKEPPPPPGPPDISWLWQEGFEEVSRISDIPSALLIMPEGDKQSLVQQAFEESGYLVQAASSEREAVKKLHFANLTGVVLQTDNQHNPLEKSVLHGHMRRLPMNRRRLIYYVLIGPDFHTMYDLQALSLSANLVVNDKDVHRLKVILRKGLKEYENLFNPLLMMLREYGKI